MAVTPPTHWLVVHDDPRDGISLEHENCPTRPGSLSTEQHPYEEHDCLESYVWSEAEHARYFTHRDEHDGEPDEKPLAPGRYRVTATGHAWRTWDGDWDDDYALHLPDTPQE